MLREVRKPLCRRLELINLLLRLGNKGIRRIIGIRMEGISGKDSMGLLEIIDLFIFLFFLNLF